jgi:hypothetical protein
MTMPAPAVLLTPLLALFEIGTLVCSQHVCCIAGRLRCQEPVTLFSNVSDVLLSYTHTHNPARPRMSSMLAADS